MFKNLYFTSLSFLFKKSEKSNIEVIHYRKPLRFRAAAVIGDAAETVISRSGSFRLKARSLKPAVAAAAAEPKRGFLY